MTRKISRRSFLKGTAVADANKLAAAIIIAPFAGIAAAMGKFYKMTKNRGM